jgi:hypothetical protein
VSVLEPAPRTRQDRPVDDLEPQQDFNVSRRYPAHWPPAYCAVALAWELLDGIDLRQLRGTPIAKQAVLTARRAARNTYKAVLNHK